MEKATPPPQLGRIAIKFFGKICETWREIFMANCVLRPIGVIGIVVTTLIASSDAGIGAPANTAGADDCLSAPNSPAPAGEHWYYHLDRAKQRKCWYLRSPTEAQPITEVAPAIHDSREKSAQDKSVQKQPVFTKLPARSGGAPAPTRADGAAVLPDIRTAEPSSIPDRSTLQESAGQSRIAAPPSPTPAVTTVQPDALITAPSDAQRGNAKAPDSRNVRSAGRKTEPTINSEISKLPGTPINSEISKLPGTPNFLALVLMLGLIASVAGDLWCAVRKLVSVKQQILMHPVTADEESTVSANEKTVSFTTNGEGLKREHEVARVNQQIASLLGTPRIEEYQRQQEWCEDQQQSLTHLVTADDACPSSATEKHGVVTSNSGVLNPENFLARLSQEIDGLSANPNKKDAALRSNSKALKPDAALERLSQEMDWLLQKPRLA